MAWIDYKKAYDFISHSWIKDCMELTGIAKNVRELLLKRMKRWKVSLTTNRNELGEVKFNRGTFQGDSLSPLLFVLCMISMSLVL